MQAPSKSEVENLGSKITQQRDSLIKSEADKALSGQIEQLESKLEDTNFRLANLSQQIAATNQELKAFRNLPRFTQPLMPVAPSGLPAGSGATPTDPQALYNNAYDDYVRGSYNLATQQFRAYLKSFPDTEFSDNAAYWIGESYYRQSQFRQAITEFDHVLDRYPGSDKVPSALLKKGYAYLEQGDQSKGMAQLQYVVREYPSSDEARLAAQRLRELGIDAP